MKYKINVQLISLLSLLLYITAVPGDAKTSPGNKNPEASKKNVTDKAPAEKKNRSSKVGELMKKQKQAVVFRAAYGNGPGQLGCVIPEEASPEGPMSFTVDTTGRILILDQLNTRIQVFDKNGTYQKAIPIPNQFVSDMDIGPSGNLFLLDGYGTKSVLLIDQKGRILKKTGLKGKCVDHPEQVTEMYRRGDGIWVESDGLYVNICDESGDDVGDRAVAPFMPCGDGNHHLKVKKLGDITALVTWRLTGDYSEKLYTCHIYTEIPVMHFTLADTDKKGNMYIGMYLWDEETPGPPYNLDDLHHLVVIFDGKGTEKKRIYMPVSSHVFSPTRMVRITPEGTIYQILYEEKEAVMWRYAP